MRFHGRTWQTVPQSYGNATTHVSAISVAFRYQSSAMGDALMRLVQCMRCWCVPAPSMRQRGWMHQHVPDASLDEELRSSAQLETPPQSVSLHSVRLTCFLPRTSRWLCRLPLDCVKQATTAKLDDQQERPITMSPDCIFPPSQDACTNCPYEVGCTTDIRKPSIPSASFDRGLAPSQRSTPASDRALHHERSKRAGRWCTPSSTKLLSSRLAVPIAWKVTYRHPGRLGPPGRLPRPLPRVRELRGPQGRQPANRSGTAPRRPTRLGRPQRARWPALVGTSPQACCRIAAGLPTCCARSGGVASLSSLIEWVVPTRS